MRLRFSVVIALVAGLALGVVDAPAGEASRQVAGRALVERLAHAPSARVVVALVPERDAKAALLRRVRVPDGFRPTARWDAVAGVPGVVTAEGLAALARESSVLRVDLDLGGRGADAESLPLVHGDAAHAAGFTGAGVTVAVVDSGVDRTHPDLAPALQGEQCFVTPNGCPNGTAEQAGAGSGADDHGHGTNVTGIVLGRGGVAPIGVAPAAGFVAVKVLDRNNEFRTISQVISALNWIALNRPDVRVVNMSLGTFALFQGACDNANAGTIALASVVGTLRARGVTLFASAGNEASPNAIAAPACLSGVVAVGAVYDADVGPVSVEGLCSDAVTSADKIACFSNSSSQLDLLAPGAFILSTGRAGGTSTFAGTSQASPHAAGAAALLLQQTPTLTPDAVESALESSGLLLTDARNGLARPRLDISAALRLTTPQTPVADLAVGRRPLAFGAVRVGTRKDLPLLVTNRGTGPLVVRPATRKPFAVVSRGPVTVPAGGQRFVRVRFAPGLARAYRGALTLTTNDPDSPRATVPLRGVGGRR